MSYLMSYSKELLFVLRAFVGGHRAELRAHVVSGHIRAVERVRLRALRSILFIVLRCILIPAAPHHQHDHKHQHDEDGD